MRARSFVRDVFVDLDGVIGDWMRSAIRLLKREDLMDDWPIGCSRLSGAVGMGDADVDAVIDSVPTFWRDIEPLPWKKELIQTLTDRFDKIRILTSGGRFRHALAGKAEWCARHQPDLPLITMKEKEMLARPDRLLIDDDDRNVLRWRNAGGVAITFPQPWNEAHDYVKTRIQHVRWQLDLLAIGGDVRE